MMRCEVVEEMESIQYDTAVAELCSVTDMQREVGGMNY